MSAIIDEADLTKAETDDFDFDNFTDETDETDETPTEPEALAQSDDQADEAQADDQPETQDYQTLFLRAQEKVYAEADPHTGVPTRRDLVGASVPFSHLTPANKAEILSAFTDQMRAYLSDPSTFTKARTALELKTHLESLGAGVIDDPLTLAIRRINALQLASLTWTSWDSAGNHPDNPEYVPAYAVHSDENDKLQLDREQSHEALRAFLDQITTWQMMSEHDRIEKPSLKPDFSQLPATAQMALKVMAGLDPSLMAYTGHQTRATRPSSTQKAGSDSTSPTKPRQASAGGVKRDVGAHVSEVFAALAKGATLTMGEISKVRTQEYGDTRPSQGAIAAISDTRLTRLGLALADKNGRRAYVKI